MKSLVGYLDDVYDSTSNIRRNLKKHDIELHTMSDIQDVTNVETIIDYILDNEISCLMVDYDLMQLKSKKYGTIVIKELNDSLPSFPCFLLTNYVGPGQDEKIVQSIFVEDKDIFVEDSDSERFVNFIFKIKNGIDCYKNRIELTLTDYELLFKKYKEKSITSEEEYKFHSLYRILKAYHYVDDIPDFLLYKETKDSLVKMLDILDSIDKKIEEK